LQLVPSYLPAERPADWKRPIIKWREFETTKIPDTLFEQWYGQSGEHRSRSNMGMICGAASGGIFIVDLDTHKTDAAMDWWSGLLAVHENGIPLETPRQTTGGGGKQMLFRAPEGWVSPTCRTSIGVDIRGQGGFAVLAPSRHASGNFYTWDIGPWDAEVAEAPQWLCEAIDSLVEEHGGSRGVIAQPRVHTASTADYDAFGNQVDGREDYMKSVVWGAVLDLRREAPMKPQGAHSDAAMLAAYNFYVSRVRTRLPGEENENGLEKEGRGIGLFQDKWAAAMRQWDTKVSEEAAKEKPARPFDAGPEEPPASDAGPQQSEARFPFETVGDLRLLPPMKWLVKGWVPETAVGIFYGKWGTGKSFIGFDLLLHLAYGLPDWHGVELPPGPVDVLMIAREGHQGFVGRIDAFRKHRGIGDDTDRLKFMRAAVSFMREDEFKGLCEAIKATGIRFRLIMVDTVARVLAGVDTNEQQAVTLFMERCAILGRLTGAAIIGVHHQNKAGSMMGSVYFEANSDFVFEVSRPEEEGLLTAGEITCTKMKDGQDRWKKTTAYKLIQLNPFDPDETSLVVERIGDPAPQTAPGGRDLSFIMGEVKARWEARDPFAIGNQGKRLTLEIWLMQAAGMRRNDAKQVVEKLVGMEAIRPEQFDAKRKLTGWKPAKWSF
jgi:hypothetical protein